MNYTSSTQLLLFSTTVKIGETSTKYRSTQDGWRRPSVQDPSTWKAPRLQAGAGPGVLCPPSRPQDLRVEYWEDGPSAQVTWHLSSWPLTNRPPPVLTQAEDATFILKTTLDPKIDLGGVSAASKILEPGEAYMKKIKNEITTFRPGPVVLEKGVFDGAQHSINKVGVPVARSGKGVRSTDRSNSAPKNNPKKYSTEQAVSAGSQLMTLSL